MTTPNEPMPAGESATTNRILRSMRPVKQQETYFWRGYVAVARLVAVAMAITAGAEYLAKSRGYEITATIAACKDFLDYAVPVLMSLLGVATHARVQEGKESS